MLTQIADGLYGFEMMLKLPMGLTLPTRGSVVRLADESLLVHAPVALDDDTTRAITALGDVRHIVAPNLVHNLFVNDAAVRFPKARVHASASLRKKRPDLAGTNVLERGARTTPFPGLEATFLGGAPGIDESVFFHERSGSLLCTDLVFNVTKPATFGTRFFLTCVGCNARFANSRVWGLLARDRAALSASASGIFAWPFTRVVMGHGDVLAHDARERLHAALSVRVLAKDAPRLAASTIAER
jgi:hypothetical protein